MRSIWWVLPAFVFFTGSLIEMLRHRARTDVWSTRTTGLFTLGVVGSLLCMFLGTGIAVLNAVGWVAGCFLAATVLSIPAYLQLRREARREAHTKKK